jgi:hypothetical protein
MILVATVSQPQEQAAQYFAVFSVYFNNLEELRADDSERRPLANSSSAEKPKI